MKKNANGNAGIMIKHRPADEKPEESHDDGMESCASDLIRAIQSNDPKGVADALRSAYDICESQEPKEDNESIEPHSYDHQKE